MLDPGLSRLFSLNEIFKLMPVKGRIRNTWEIFRQDITDINFLRQFRFYDAFCEGIKEVFYNGVDHPAPRGHFFQKLSEKDPCLNSDFDGLFGDAILDNKAIATTYMANGNCHAVVVVGMNDEGFFAKNTYTDCSLTVRGITLNVKNIRLFNI